MKTKQFKPMLAAALDQSQMAKVSFPVYVSPKLDGIRCVIRNGKALTRSLKPVPNKVIRDTLEELARSGLDGCDGELMIDDATFQEITSSVMSPSAEPHGEWYFAVFDHYACDGMAEFNFRIAAAQTRVQSIDSQYVRLVPHELIETEDQLLQFEQDVLADGFEGVMLRDPEGLYKFGRSTLREGGLLKLKRFTDDEAVVIGVVELQHNENEAFTGELGQTKRSTKKAGKTGGGTLGALRVRHPVFGEFELGTGFTEEQRGAYWTTQMLLVGKTVKFKYFAVGVKDKPRHPVFLGFRAAEDMS